MMSVELSAVNKYFGARHAVADLSLSIPEGSVYGFLGPNGAGKTSTIRMIMSILYPDSGELRVLGNAAPERVKDRLGYLPEEKGLYKKMRVLELITYFGRLKGLSQQSAIAKARTLLEQFGLVAVENQRCESLSKGMGQKVQIIATIIHDPELIILDEPFSGLDPINVELVRDLILQLRAEGRTVIFSTHIMEQAEQLCDHLLLIDGGKKLIDGSVESVKKQFEPTITVEYQGDPSHLHQPGINRVNNMGRMAELSVTNEADGQQILKQLMQHLEITSFAFKEPSLHEIFVRTVRTSKT